MLVKPMEASACEVALERLRVENSVGSESSYVGGGRTWDAGAEVEGRGGRAVLLVDKTHKSQSS